MSEESLVLRKNLMKLEKPALIKKCRKYNLSERGSKGEIVDRLVEYNEMNGGVTDSNEKRRKNSKSNNNNGGFFGDCFGDHSGNNRNRGNNSGRTSVSGNKGNNGSHLSRLQWIALLIGIGVLLLYVFALISNVLSKIETNDISIECSWDKVNGCYLNNCGLIYFDDECNDNVYCDKCDACKTLSAGKVWLGFNILGCVIILISIFVLFVDNSLTQSLKWFPFIGYIIALLSSLIALISWIGLNNYSGSCYQPNVDVKLGVSNILDILIIIILIPGILIINR